MSLVSCPGESASAPMMQQIPPHSARTHLALETAWAPRYFRTPLASPIILVPDLAYKFALSNIQPAAAKILAGGEREGCERSFAGKGDGHCAPPARDWGTAVCHSAALGRPTSSWRWNCRTAATQVSRDRNCWKERLAATIHLHVSLSCTSIQNQPSMEIATNVTANYTVRPAG